MKPQELKHTINEQIIKASNLDLHRDYLGISKISGCPRAAVREYRQGIAPDSTAYRMSYAGYEHERSILNLFIGAGLIKAVNVEVTAPFDSRLRGHIDAVLMSDNLLECKSVSVRKYETILKNNRPTLDHFTQVQLYMRYGGFGGAFVVYRCRETYEHEIFFVEYDNRRAMEFENKAIEILSYIDQPEIVPPCTCHRCAEGWVNKA